MGNAKHIETIEKCPARGARPRSATRSRPSPKEFSDNSLRASRSYDIRIQDAAGGT